jgi:hypothetical protein
MNSSLRGEQDLGPAAVQERYTDLCTVVSTRPCLNSPCISCSIPPPIFLHWPGYLTANIPAAVTILLFSLFVKAERVLDAKLGSLRVRPLPVICLGGIVAVVSVKLRNRKYHKEVVSISRGSYDVDYGSERVVLWG